jgi:hypothetical protein
MIMLPFYFDWHHRPLRDDGHCRCVSLKDIELTLFFMEHSMSLSLRPSSMARSYNEECVL